MEVNSDDAESKSVIELATDGVADVADRKQARRSGGAWQDRMGCGFNPESQKGFTDIMKNDRICTDIPWLLAYVVFVIGLFAVVYIPAYVNGDADWILYGVDYERRVCGVSSGVEDRPLAIWPDTTIYDLKMCVESCSATRNTANVLSIADGGIGRYNSTAIGGAWCIPTADIVDDGEEYCQWKEVMLITGGGLVLVALVGLCMACTSKKCRWPCVIISVFLAAGGGVALYFGFDCGDAFATASGTAVLEGYDSFSNVLTKQIANMSVAMPVIGGAFAFAIIFGFFYIFLMEKAVSCIVWSGIVLIILAGLFIGALFFWRVSTEEDDDSPTVVAEQICGAIALVATLIFMCIVYWLKDRIEIACEVVKSSSRAVVDLPTLFVFPCCPLFLAVIFAMAWAYAQIYVFSTGDWITADMPSGLVGQTNMYEDFPGTYQYLDSLGELGNTTFWLSLLLFLWTMNIIVYWAYMVLAGTIADWYFTVRVNGKKKRGDKINELASNPLWSSMKRTTFNHLGSIFYAAFIIAIIQLVRALIEYVQSVTDKASNPFTRCLFRCVKCLLYCLECCCRWIGKNALVWVSIFGDCFCESAYASFNLQWSNLARVAMMTLVSKIVIMVGKFVILAVPTGLAGLILMTMEPYKSDISSLTFPLVIIAILNYFVGWILMEVYETCVDTVFLCFLVDEDNNMETGLLADQGLTDLVDKYKKENANIAQRRKKVMGNLGTIREITAEKGIQEVEVADVA